jgi:hypothetical protein
MRYSMKVRCLVRPLATTLNAQVVIHALVDRLSTALPISSPTFSPVVGEVSRLSLKWTHELTEWWHAREAVVTWDVMLCFNNISFFSGVMLILMLSSSIAVIVATAHSGAAVFIHFLGPASAVAMAVVIPPIVIDFLYQMVGVSEMQHKQVGMLRRLVTKRARYRDATALDIEQF